MRLVIFGATGGTGRAMLQQALDDGHEVTAIVRQPAALGLTHVRLRVLTGDVMQPASFAFALLQQDAVLSALGSKGFWNFLKPLTFYRRSARLLVEQMTKAGVQRLVCLTSVGVSAKPVGPWFYVWLLKPLLKPIYDDMRQMEQLIRASELAWTIVRPSRLVDGERTGRYRVGESGELAQANSISRADVADAMLNQLATTTNWHQTIAVAY